MITYKQEIKGKLKNGENFSNDVSGWWTVNRGNELAIFNNEKYTFYKNYTTFTNAVIRLINRG